MKMNSIRYKWMLVFILSAVLVMLPLVFLLIVLTSSVHEIQGLKMVIDQDAGADDAMAIYMALLYEKYFNGPQVVGITTVNGNVNEVQAFNNTQRILSVVGRRDIPIYRGCGSSIIIQTATDHFFGVDGLSDTPEFNHYEAIEADPLHAVPALIQMSKQYPGELIVVCIGPLTNLAMVLTLDPDFINRVKHIYVGGGNIYSSAFPNPEFNADMDAEAYFAVMKYATSFKVTVIPFSQSWETLVVDRDWRLNVLGTIPTETMRALNHFEYTAIMSLDIWTMLDPAAMAVVLDRSVVNETKYSKNSILLCYEERGKNTNEFTSKSQGNVEIIHSFNKEPYLQLLLNIFNAELHNQIIN